jgi:hypothetical protein
MAISKGIVRGLCAAAAAGVLAMAGAAHADVTWIVTGTFNDGGTLSGTFTMNQYDYLVGDFSITTTAGSAESGFTYTAANSYFSNSSPGGSPVYIDFQPQYYSDLHIQFANDLGVPAASDAIIGGYQGPSFECQNSWSCPNGSAENYAIRYLVSGQATMAPIPEPATWGLMIVGLGGLGAALRVNRRKPALGIA